MSRSAYRWLAVFYDDNTETVSATTAENAIASLNRDPVDVVALIRQDLA